MKNTCENCIHCTHRIKDAFDEYFYCEIDLEYIGSRFALNEEIGCDAFVENLDDDSEEKS